MQLRRRVTINKVFNMLVGQPCWGVIAGSGTGSVISLAFGLKTPRHIPLPNPHLTDELRHHEGEFSLFVLCAWRLQSSEQVICSSTSSNAANGTMRKGLRRLVGDTVSTVALGYPAFDLTVCFASGLSLLVFCDISRDEDEMDNYDYFVRDEVITVCGGGDTVIKRNRYRLGNANV